MQFSEYNKRMPLCAIKGASPNAIITYALLIFSNYP